MGIGNGSFHPKSDATAKPVKFLGRDCMDPGSSFFLWLVLLWLFLQLTYQTDMDDIVAACCTEGPRVSDHGPH